MLFKLLEELFFLKNWNYYLEVCINSGSTLGIMLLRVTKYLAVSLLIILRLIIGSGGNSLIPRYKVTHHFLHLIVYSSA